MFFVRTALAALVWSISAVAAQAAVVTLDFSGKVTVVTHEAFNTPLGSAFTGRLTFDNAVAAEGSAIKGLAAGYDSASYRALISYSLQFAGFSVSATGPGMITVQDGISAPFGDFFSVYANQNVGPALPIVGTPDTMTMNLSDEDPGRFSGTQLPGDLGIFPSSIVQATFTGPNRGQQVLGEIDHLTYSVVPEPAVWAFMTTGFLLAGTALRRRRAPVMAL